MQTILLESIVPAISNKALVIDAARNGFIEHAPGTRLACPQLCQLFLQSPSRFLPGQTQAIDS
jgi:hypothetical protein